MEKVAYTLLMKHANKYWQMEHDDEDEDKNAHNKHHVISSQKIHQRPTTICGVFEPSKKEIIGENEINKAVPVPLPPPGIQSNSKYNNMNPFLPVQIPRKSLQRKSMDRFGCSPVAINNKR